MPEPRMPQQDRPKKTRSFGSFLLFLTILVAILLVIGKQSLGRVKEYSQDQYYWELYKGEVEQQEFKGSNRVEGRLRNGVRFSVQFADVAQREEELRALAATQIQHEIEPEALLAALAEGDYQAQLARLVTASQEYQENVSTGDGGEQAPTVRRGLKERHKRLFVSVFARGKDAGSRAPDYFLPSEADLIWLRVKPLGDLPTLTADLKGFGARIEDTVTLAITDQRGSSWQNTSSLLSNVLLVYGPWLLIFAVFLIFMRQMRNQGAAGGVMSFGRSRAQLYTKENHTNITFDDVAGAEEAKDEVREVVEFLKNPSRFTRIGGRIPRGILLVGSPGCGKTLLAKAIAGEAEVPFYSISGSDFVEMFVGVGASRVRDLFKQSRENSPCIIFLDEIDAVGRRRGSGMGGGHDEREQTLNAILVEMDGFGTDEGIIVLAATNRPDVLDPALLRPGRFDREVTIDLPDIEGRKAILEVHLKKVKAGTDIDTETVARSTPGYSGADLAATVNEAAIMAALSKSEVVLMEHLEEARDKVRYGRQKKSRKVEEEDRKITARHEAGHAIVATVIEETDGPHKVTIVPRGRALGSTMVLPEKESYHMQKRRLLGQLAVLFGGRASEELLCGDISAGASDDIKRATEVARAMVTELGMSEEIGPINYADRQGSDFLGTELLAGKWHSEDTARKIDGEVKKLLDDAYERASSIVSEHRDEIERLSDALLEYETISGVEIRRLLDGVSVADLRPQEDPPSGPPAPTPVATSPRGDVPPSGKQLPGDIAGEPGLSPA